MNGSTRERLARKKLDKNREGKQAQDPPDELHNLDSPNCILLSRAVVDIIPESSSSQQEEQSILGKLIRRHLQDEIMTSTCAVSNSGTANTTSSTSKKKKKRKKKKKTSATSVSENETEETNAPSSLLQEDSGVEKSSSKESEADSLPTDDGAHGPPPAAAPPPPPSSTAEAILQQWLMSPSVELPTTDDDSLYKNRELACFLQYIANLDSMQLDCNQARAALDSIACHACKQVATSYYWNRLKLDFRIDSTYMVLPRDDSLSSPLEVPGGMEQVEHAFDYIAMEEGMGESQEQDAILVFSPDDDFLTSTNHTALTMQQLHALVKDMILAHGLTEPPVVTDESNSMDTFWNENIAPVIMNVQQEEASMRQFFVELETQQATLLAKLEDSVIGGFNFDVRTSQNFHAYDQELNVSLHQMIKIVRNVSTRHYLSSGRIRAPEVSQVVQDLYTWIAETIRLLLTHQLKHSARLIQLSARPGAIPQMAVSAQHRSSYRDLLLHKVTQLQTLRRELFSILLEKYVLRRIVSCALMDGMAYPKTPSPDESDGLDGFYKVAETMTHTIRSGNVQDVKETQVSRTLEWLKWIQAEAANVGTNEKTAYKRLLSEVKSHQEVVENEEDDEDAREEAISQFTLATFDLFHHTLNQILYNKRTTETYKYEGEFTMPPKLEAFLQGQDQGGGPCQGGGARRRITSILLGLTYKWLQDRCNEWHAELTQQELLESMVIDDGVASEFKPAKTKKSKKKRDKERKNAGANSALNEATGPTTSANKKEAGKDAVEATGAENPSFATTAGKNVEKLDASTAKPVDKQESASHATEESANKPTVSGDTVDSNGAEAADTWSEWRADLNSTGLLDTSFVEDDLVPKDSNEEEFKVATSRRTRKKAAMQNGGDKKVGTSSATVDRGPKAISKILEKPDASSTSSGRKEQGETSSNAKDERDHVVSLPLSGKALSTDKVDSSKQASDRNGKEKDAPKENNNRARSASIPTSETSTQNEDAKKKSPSRATPPNVLSSVSKTSPPKTPNCSAANSTATLSKTAEPAQGKKEKAQPMPVESKRSQKTPERGAKGKGPQIQVNSGKKTYSPRNRPGPAAASVDVGVASATGFQSAEGFLVERLMEALRAAESSKQ